MNKTTLLSIAATSAIVTGAHAQDSDWESSFNLGATFTRGNSESSLITLGLATSKKTSTDEYFAALNYTFSDSDEETTSDELLGSAAWNHLVSEHTYTGLRFDFRTDKLADIDYRTGLTGVLGHYFIKNDSTYLAGEVGIGFTTEQAGGISDNYANAYIGDRFEHKFDEKTRVYQTLVITAPIEDLADYSLVAELGLETTLSDKLALRLYIQDKYEEEPAAGLDNNDVKVVTGISYKF